MNRTLHERVAAIMAGSVTVGPYASYETILASLRERFPAETDLRKMIDEMEHAARRTGMVPPDWKFISEPH